MALLNWYAPADTASVTGFYQAFLNRVPDAAGLAFWTSGAFTIGQVVQDFLTGAEYLADLPTATSASVTALYNTILGRAPDPGGLAFWIGQPTPQVVTGFLSGAEFAKDYPAQVPTNIGIAWSIP